MEVNQQVEVPFSIDKYEDIVLCDVVPMEASHVLLGRPWQFDKKALHDGFSNKISFMHKNNKIVLSPLTPSQVREDKKKMREKFESEKKNEKKKERVLVLRKDPCVVEGHDSTLIGNCSFSNNGVERVVSPKKVIDIVPSGPLFTKPSFGSPIQESKLEGESPKAVVKLWLSLDSLLKGCIEKDKVFLERLCVDLFLLSKENNSRTNECNLKGGTYLCLMMHLVDGDSRFRPPPLKRKRDEIQWEDDYEHVLLFSKSSSICAIECGVGMSILSLGNELLGNNEFNPTLMLNVECLDGICYDGEYTLNDKAKGGAWTLLKEHEMGLSMHDPKQRFRCQVLGKIKLKGECLRVCIALSLKSLHSVKGEEKPNSRSNSIEEGGDDVNPQRLKLEEQGSVPRIWGPMTRSRTKQANQALNHSIGLKKEANNPTLFQDQG